MRAAQAGAATIYHANDFVSARTYDGRSVRLLNLIDEHARDGLLVRADRRWSSARGISALADVMVVMGIPEALRSFDPDQVRLMGHLVSFH